MSCNSRNRKDTWQGKIKIANSKDRLACGSVAEWSKALVLGTSHFDGVGSNPTAAMFLINFCSFFFYRPVSFAGDIFNGE